MSGYRRYFVSDRETSSMLRSCFFIVRIICLLLKNKNNIFRTWNW